MISKIIWTLKADKTIEKVTKETNKLFANGVASTEYGLICDDIAENDVVFIIAKRGTNEYAQRMKRQLITLEDGSTKMGWSVVSNGIELNFALSSGSVPITFSFKIERFSELDATTLVSRYTTQTDTALCYSGSAYVPEVEPTDAEQIIEDLVGLENRVLDIETNIGDLDDLGTENKDNLVEAINEVDGLAKQNKSDIEDIEEKIEDIDGLKTNKLDKSVTENGVTSTFDRYGNIGSGFNNRPFIRTIDTNNNSGAEVKIYSSGSQEQFQIDVDKATNNQYKSSNIFVSPTEIRLKNDQDVVGRTKELKITDQKVTINNKEVATETEIDNVQNGVDQNSYDIGQLASQILDLQNITPSQATSTNQLADKDFVNSSINNIASFYITKNAQGDPFESYAELISTSTYYSGGEVRVPTRNDYCIVRDDENHDNATTRYSYQNNQWEYQYTVNATGFTQAQLKALNSGITAELVEQIQQGGSQPASETVLGTVRFWADADGTLRMSTLPYVEPTSPIASDTTYCADSLICDE